MYVLITCKYEKDLIKNSRENMMTSFLAHLSREAHKVSL